MTDNMFFRLSSQHFTHSSGLLLADKNIQSVHSAKTGWAMIKLLHLIHPFQVFYLQIWDAELKFHFSIALILHIPRMWQVGYWRWAHFFNDQRHTTSSNRLTTMNMEKHQSWYKFARIMKTFERKGLLSTVSCRCLQECPKSIYLSNWKPHVGFSKVAQLMPMINRSTVLSIWIREYIVIPKTCIPHIEQSYLSRQS